MLATFVADQLQPKPVGHGFVLADHIGSGGDGPCVGKTLCQQQLSGA